MAYLQASGFIPRPHQREKAGSRAGNARHLSMEDAENMGEFPSNEIGPPLMSILPARGPMMQQTCAACGDYAEKLFTCKCCGKSICVDKGPQNACILAPTLSLGETDFSCSECILKLGPLPYVIQNHSLAFHYNQRTTNPLSLFMLTHDEPHSNYGASMIWSQFGEEFSANPNALQSIGIQLELRGSRRPVIQEKVAPIATHLHRTNGDFLLFVDAHSDYKSGKLIYGRQPNGDEVSDGVDIVMWKYMGPDLRDAMKEGTGLRGVVLMTCGPSWTVLSHYDKMLKMFTSSSFDFLLGFSGISVVPRTVIPSVVMFLSQVYMNRDAPIVAFKRVFCNDRRLAVLTPINLIYKEHDGGVIRIQSKQIVYSSLKTRMWGLAPVCGNPCCDGLPGNIVFRSRSGIRGDRNHDQVSCVCRSCNWGMRYIQRPDWLVGLHQPFFFMHDYPLTKTQEDVFTSAMAPMST